MKTVSERATLHHAVAEATADRVAEMLKRWQEYVDEIEAKDIPVFVNDHPAYKRHDYDRARQYLRLKIRGQGKARSEPLPEGQMWINTGQPLGGFIDTACDNCKTALWDRDPHMTLTSSPPCFWADCMGCGNSYALGMGYRVRGDV